MSALHRFCRSPDEPGLSEFFDSAAIGCFNGESSPSIALSDLPDSDPNVPACRSTARVYLAIAVAVILANLLLVAMSVFRIRNTSPLEKDR